MDHFEYKDGVLHAENTPIADIVNEVGTPFYCYSKATFERHFNVFSKSFSELNNFLCCFAVKANSNVEILKLLGSLGSGADTVSQGEIMRALKAGISPSKIVFSGVGKTKEEIAYALNKGIKQFNVESREELISINEVAGTLGKKAPVAFRINPDVAAETHEKISTGRARDKFGIAWQSAEEVYQLAGSLDNIEVKGITTHIGSQLTKLSPFEQAFDKIIDMVKGLREQGHNIETLDLGGGLGITYDGETPPTPSNYAAMICSKVKDLDVQLILEPGRLIAGNAGILVSSVIYLKKTQEKNFLVIDAAMNDLARPALYDAYHKIIPTNEPKKGDELIDMEIVGPVCETGDIMGKDRKLPELEPEELIAIRSAGAYGATMSSTYNSRPLATEVLVDGDSYEIIRQRQTYEDLIG